MIKRAPRKNYNIDKTPPIRRSLHVKVDGDIFDELTAVAESMLLKPHSFLCLIIANTLSAAKKGNLSEQLMQPKLTDPKAKANTLLREL